VEVLSAPLTLSLAINSKCNLDCKYCYAQPFTWNEMKKEDAFRILDQAKKMQIFQVVLEGGEPTLHRDMFEILEYTLSLGFEANLVTNGTTMTPQKAKKFRIVAEKYQQWPGVQVSIDAVQSEINDRTRGKGERVKIGIETLLNEGVPISLGIVVTHSNVEHLKEIVDEYYPRITKYHFIGLMPTWKSTLYASELRLTEQDCKVLAKIDNEINQMMRRGPNLEVTMLRDKDDFPQVQDEQAKIVCNAGYHQIIVNSDLTVATCDIAPNISIGDLKHQTLREVWESTELKELRATGLPPCILNLQRDKHTKFSEIDKNIVTMEITKMRRENIASTYNNTSTKLTVSN